MLTSALIYIYIYMSHANECPTIYFRKILTSLLWKMKKAIKTLIFFFFSHKKAKGNC